VRQLEAWAKGELLGLTGKVKAVLAGCAAHQQQVNLQVRRCWAMNGRGPGSSVASR
jgi:hypothetical protein